jgi:hypothetical protein
MGVNDFREEGSETKTSDVISKLKSLSNPKAKLDDLSLLRSVKQESYPELGQGQNQNQNNARSDGSTTSRRKLTSIVAPMKESPIADVSSVMVHDATVTDTYTAARKVLQTAEESNIGHDLQPDTDISTTDRADNQSERVNEEVESVEAEGEAASFDGIDFGEGVIDFGEGGLPDGYRSDDYVAARRFARLSLR